MFKRQSSNVSLSSKLEDSTELPYNYVKMDNTSINSELNSDGFISVEGMYPSADDAANTLALCQKYLIGPYDVLLSLIGWRKFQSDRCGTCMKIINTLYPIFIFTMLVVASIAQVGSCFSRTKDTVSKVMNETQFHILRCDNHLITFDGLSDILLLLAYVLAIYAFRVGEPEHLSSLAETVLLSFHDSSIHRSRRKPLFILLAIFFAGVGFFFASIGLSTLRLFALQLNQSKTIIGWFSSDLTHENQSEVLVYNMSLPTYNNIQYILVAVSFLGFTFFDLLYIAVTVNYCSQCQLLTFYIDNLQDKVRNKKYPNLKVAMIEIHKVQKYLKILNGNVSVITSLIFLILVSNAIRSYSSLVGNNPRHNHCISITTGFLNTAQWTVAVIFPALLAARLTASGNELRRLGQEIAVKPFYYTDTPDLELKLFLNFTEYTRYEAYLAFIPMQPSFVLGFGYAVLVLISSGIIISRVESVVWF